MSLSPVLQVFFDEAEELVGTFEAGVLGLEAAPDDREVLYSIFRAAHTLKGNSRMLGFGRIAIMTHALEELLARLRAGESAPGREVIDTLHAASDMLGVLVARARAGDDGDVPELGALGDRLADPARSVGHHPTAMTTGSAPVAADPDAEPALYEIRFEVAADLVQRGFDPLGLLEALGDLGELVRVEADPPALLPSADLESSYPVFTTWLRTRVPRMAVEACFDFVDEGAVRVTLVHGPPGGTVATTTPAAPAFTAAPAVPSVGSGRRGAAGPAPWTAERQHGAGARAVGAEEIERFVKGSPSPARISAATRRDPCTSTRTPAAPSCSASPRPPRSAGRSRPSSAR